MLFFAIFVIILYENFKSIVKLILVGIYVNPEFNENQMREIRLGLEKNIDVTPYLNPTINWDEMERIRLKLESGK